MDKICVQEGIHTFSVYFSPSKVGELLEVSQDGLTIIISRDTMALDTVFQKDDQYTQSEINTLVEHAEVIIEEIYGHGT